MNTINPFPCVKASRPAILWLAALIGAAVPGLASTASPVLNYSTFIGGGGTSYSGEIGTGIAIGPGGFVYFVGITTAGDTFPYTHRFGNLNETLGSFVGKYNPANHTLVYLTFIPGCVGRGIAVDGLGNAYLTGECYGLPVTNAVQPDFGGGYYDAFAVKLNPDGTRLLYATFLGGANVDMGRRIAVNNAGEAIITGFTASTNFPTRAALQSQLAGNYDAFLVKLDASGSNFVYSTYLGGASADFGSGLAVDSSGDIYISGWTQSDSFSAGPMPVQLGTANSVLNAFVAKVAAAGNAVQYLTFFGGSRFQMGSAVAVDGGNNAYVFGQTDSTDFPVTANALQTNYAGGSWDNFVVKLNPSGSGFVYATYLGGSSDENHRESIYYYDGLNDGYLYLPLADISVDAVGDAYVAGWTGSDDIAAIAFNRRAGSVDGYVAKVNPAGTALLSFRYFGGSGYNLAAAVRVDGSGNLFVTGNDGIAFQPPYFPVTPGAFQPRYGGDIQDAYFVHLSETATLSTNDHFTNSVDIGGLARVTMEGNNSDASVEASEPQHAGQAGGKSLWWSWTAPASGFLTVSTKGSTFNTLLAVYTGATVAGLTPVAGNDDESVDTLTSQVRFPVTAGSVYRIAVDGKGDASGHVSLSLTFSAPSNDDFANRIPISGFPAAATGSNVDATLEPDEIRLMYVIPSHLEAFGSRSVWWSWTAPASAIVAITTAGSSFDTFLAVYTNSDYATLGSAAAPNDNETNDVVTSRVVIQALAGTTYQIAVNSRYDSAGTVQLAVGPAEPPPNDNFTNRIVLSGTLLQTTNFNSSATIEPGEPSLALSAPGGKTVWWTWTAPAEGWVAISTFGSDFNTRLGVFTGDTLGGLSQVGADDDQRIPGPFFYLSQVRVPVTSNTAYQILVDGSQDSAYGRLVLNLQFSQPPSIASFPAAWQPGAPFTLNVTSPVSKSYRIEVSTNLSTWTLLPEANLSGPNFNFTDTNTSFLRQRFYRVIEAP